MGAALKFKDHTTPPQERCPKCGWGLVISLAYSRREYRCPQGHGRAYSLSAIHHWLEGNFQQDFEIALSGGREGKRSCAFCQKGVRVVTIASVPFEICQTCSHAWLTEKAIAQLPWKKAEERAATPESPLQWEFSPTVGPVPVVGDPFLNLNIPEKSFPPATLFLLSACIFVTSRFWHQNQPDLYVFRTDHPFQAYGLSWVLALFTHGDLVHLAGNAYFLFFSGRALESMLGWRRLFALFFLSGLGGDFLFFLSRDHASGIGASGGISGMLAALALSQPQAKYRLRVGEWLPFLPLPISLRIPLWLWFGAWICLNFSWLRSQESAGATSIGYSAHIGGAFTGIILVLLGIFPKEKGSS